MNKRHSNNNKAYVTKVNVLEHQWRAIYAASWRGLGGQFSENFLCLLLKIVEVLVRLTKIKNATTSWCMESCTIPDSRLE